LNWLASQLAAKVAEFGVGTFVVVEVAPLAPDDPEGGADVDEPEPLPWRAPEVWVDVQPASDTPAPITAARPKVARVAGDALRAPALIRFVFIASSPEQDPRKACWRR
jgi:hypothetical protein